MLGTIAMEFCSKGKRLGSTPNTTERSWRFIAKGRMEEASGRWSVGRKLLKE